jgi:uncharacterized coiled-coil DUF342 family protein
VKTFTQAEVDTIVQERLAKDRRARGDVGQLQNELDYLRAARDDLKNELATARTERAELRDTLAAIMEERDTLRLTADALRTLWLEHRREDEQRLGARLRRWLHKSEEGSHD